MSLISREEPILVCGCQSMWLPVLTIKWALSPGGTLRQRLPPEQAAMLCSSVSLHLIFQTVQFSPSCPCNELFRSSAKVCTFTCNQLKHVCTLSVHVHSNLYMWLPRIVNSYSPKACTAHLPMIISSSTMLIIFTHITFSIFWILSSERFPEVKLLRQRPQILL